MAIAELSTLEAVREKVEANERLTFEDGLALMSPTTCSPSASSRTRRGACEAATTGSSSSRTCTSTRRTCAG